MHYGKALMLFRKFRNKTQQDVAKKMNAKQQYVSQLEKQENLNGKKIDKYISALESNKADWKKFIKLLPPANEN